MGQEFHATGDFGAFFDNPEILRSMREHTTEGLGRGGRGGLTAMSWYCHDCAKETYGRRCKICGQTETEQRKRVGAHDREVARRRTRKEATDPAGLLRRDEEQDERSDDSMLRRDKE